MKNKTSRAVCKIIAAAIILSMNFLSSPYLSRAGTESNPSIPEIISRKAWGADESLMTWPVEYAPVQKIVVHHTASTTLAPDTDGSGQYKNMINAIYKYHANSKTWIDDSGATYAGFGDIGYNYIIDPDGNIYEGRFGGNGVIGGHVTGFNTGTIGISIIGNYQNGAVGQTNTTLDERVKKSLEKLIGWIAANNGIDVNKTSSLNGKTTDGVVGHRDVGQTQCPGSVIYAQLDDIQAQAALYAKEYQKYAYQIQGNSAVYIISGGYKAKFASKSSLPETYQSRLVQYISKSQLDSYQYKDIKTFPDGTLLQAKNESTVYYIQSGKKRPMSMTSAEFLKLGFRNEDIVAVSTSDLDLYETGDIIKYGPDGNLIKDSSNNVYFVENGKRRIFTSAQLFSFLKYSWTKVKADAQASSYLDGDTMRYPDGTLIKSQVSPSVYMMDGGKKRTFTSGTLFEKLGYKWSNIATIDDTELKSYPTGNNIIYPNGTLIRATGSSAVYLVDNGQKREITSATLLGKLGYSFNSVIEIPAASLSDYPAGNKAAYPDGTLIKASDSPAVYRVVKGGKEEFTSLSVFNASGAKWSNMIVISPEEMKLYATTGTVKYPDGSLIKSSGREKIYVIKNGAAVWIQTADEFIKAGYKWSNVMTIDPAEMKLYASDTDSGNNNNNNNGGNNNGNTTPTNPTTPTTSSQPNIRIALTSKYSDGALLKASNDSKIYVVKSGQATLISSSDEFTRAGYDWNNVATIDPKEMVVVLAGNAQDTKITANGNYKVEYHRVNGEVYKTVQKKSGEPTVVPFFDWDNYIRFIPESDGVIMQVLSYSDTFQSGGTTYNDNQFRGTLEMKYSANSKKLWIIEDVPLEGYLKGISEATTRTNTEYLKAFSIITRTYAMNYIIKGGKYPNEPITLKNSRNGNGNDQQYKGYSFEMRSPATANSYDQTAGQVIEYNSKPIVAAYSSDSGGTTKDACQVLSTNYCSNDYAYLKGGVKDPDNTTHNASSVAASHGAGMSAAGAYQMALNGSDWQMIIKTYYPGININKYY